MRQMSYRLFLLPLLLVMASVGAFAQANSSLTGIVTDQSGAVVAGAKVVLTDPATGISTKTTIAAKPGLYVLCRPEPCKLRPENHRQGISVVRSDRHRGQRFLHSCESMSS